uniref:Uncharacterized protein n=1 Tax=Arundo donax TaxID=35708 RepID=A0A0A9E9M6_ARUDO
MLSYWEAPSNQTTRDLEQHTSVFYR